MMPYYEESMYIIPHSKTAQMYIIIVCFVVMIMCLAVVMYDFFILQFSAVYYETYVMPQTQVFTISDITLCM